MENTLTSTPQKNGSQNPVVPRKWNRAQLYNDSSGEPTAPTFTISLDWMQISCSGPIPEADDQNNIITFDDVVLEWTGMGTKLFKDMFKVYLGGEVFGTLLCHPRSVRASLSDNIVQIQIDNALLYTNYWYESLKQVLHSLNLVYTNTTRLDICIDGLNHLPAFLTHFKNQDKSNRTVHMKGRAAYTDRFDTKRWEYQYFRIGEKTSPKYISIYNKSRELERSNKTYIQKFWQKNDIDINSPVWRFEMRFRNKAIKQYQEYNIEALADPFFMLRMVHTGCRGFFEFVRLKKGDSNISRGKVVDLLPFKALRSNPLTVLERPVTDGRYKVKLAIHKTVKHALKQERKGDDIEEELSVMGRDIEMYDLGAWYMRRLPEWIKLYTKLAPQGSGPPPMTRLNSYCPSSFN